ncbi:class I SAM-dependent methyltransferase [Aurantibacter sp.]|uniref:class I SAM-dependent methyltransferase n=1 Tax=Aurantibacter sp. TaxID=2807103 RepID=UPI0035C83D2A
MISFNKELLNIKVQDFILKNLNSDISKLILKGIPFLNIESQVIIEQIEAKKRCKTKLTSWFNTENIYYPNKLNIEQTSSEITANYKAKLIKGKTIIDITGGFGVDCFAFAKIFKSVTHCEINPILSDIVKHNYKQLNTDNITCVCNDGIEAFKTTKNNFDWIYIDPSRRSDIKGKVFLLKDCLPNVPQHLNSLFEKSNNILIKTSPLLDISSGINELKNIKTIHVVALNNEVKELLWVLEKDYKGGIDIKTVNLKNKTETIFNFNLDEESTSVANYNLPLTYLYEPNSAILKAGAFNILSTKLNVSKLHKHSHLYTSDAFIDFPGRSFKIIKELPYNKKVFKKYFNEAKANITTRNFPEKVDAIRKKLSLKDGGNSYIFFTTNLNNNKIILVCEKI